MKNTTFRKKALLSSVAMLLVALVALGSATFAWFTQNPNVEATGLQMTTEAATGLVAITKSEADAMKTTYDKADAKYWDHNVVLRAEGTQDDKGNWTFATNDEDFNLQPVSGIGSAKFTTTAGTDDYYAKDSKAAVTNAETSAYYSDIIYFKASNGTSAISDIKLTAVEITPGNSDKDIKNAVRVEVIDANGDLVGTYGLDTAGNVFYESTTKLSDTAYEYEIAKGDNNTDVSIGGIEAGKTTFVTVNVYLDGEDSTCFSRNVDAKQLISNVKLNFVATLS